MSESGPGATGGSSGAGGGGEARPERPPVRALDPATAMRLTDGRPPLPALYLSDRLSPGTSRAGRSRPRADDLRAGAQGLDLDFRVTPRPTVARATLDQPTWGTSITPRPRRRPSSPSMPGACSSDLRRPDDPIAEQLSLEHVLRPADGYWGGDRRYWGGVGGYWGGVGGTGAAWAATGAASVPRRCRSTPCPAAAAGCRSPSRLPDPALRARTVDRSPVIAVPDTADRRPPVVQPTASGVVRLQLKDGRLVPEPPPEPPPTSATRLIVGPGAVRAGRAAPGARDLHRRADPAGLPRGDDPVDPRHGRRRRRRRERHARRPRGALLDRHVARAGATAAQADVVDVLSLSIGYYAEDRTYTCRPGRRPCSTGSPSTASSSSPASATTARTPRSCPRRSRPPCRIPRSAVPPLASVGATQPGLARRRPLLQPPHRRQRRAAGGLPRQHAAAHQRHGPALVEVRPTACALHGRPRRLHRRLRGLERHLLRHPGLRRRARRGPHRRGRPHRRVAPAMRKRAIKALAHLHREGSDHDTDPHRARRPRHPRRQGVRRLLARANASGSRSSSTSSPPCCGTPPARRARQPADVRGRHPDGLPPARRPRRVHQGAGGGARLARRRRQARGLAPLARLAPRDRCRRGARGPGAAARPRGRSRSSASASACCGSTSPPSPRDARSCSGSSPSPTAPTTPPSRSRWGCRSAASARPVAAASRS